MQIEKFDKANLPLMRAEIEKALKAVGEKYGLSFRTKNIKFSEFEFTCPLEVRIEGKEAAKTDYSDVLGYPKIGLEFKANGRNYIVTDHVLSRPKYPISAKCKEDGKNYKFPAYSRVFGNEKRGNPDFENPLHQ